MGIFFVLAGSVWLYYTKREIQKAIPKSETLAGHFESMPEPEGYWIFEKNGKEFLGVIGPQRASITAPSCNPVYVFDTDTKLVVWTTDHGDDTDFIERWGVIFKGKKVDRETAMQWSRNLP